jgi:hypothetical protein
MRGFQVTMRAVRVASSRNLGRKKTMKAISMPAPRTPSPALEAAGGLLAGEDQTTTKTNPERSYVQSD